MGLKVNPHGFRLNVTRSWDSNWYGDTKYSSFVQEDIIIREYIIRKLNNFFIISDCNIKRTAYNEMEIKFSVYFPKFIKYAKRKRLYVGLIETIHKVTNLKVSLKITRYRINRRTNKQIAQLVSNKKEKKGKRKKVKPFPTKKMQQTYKRVLKVREARAQRFHRYIAEKRRTQPVRISRPKRKKLKYRWRSFFQLNKFFKIMLYRPNATLIANFLKKEVENSKNQKHSLILRFIKLNVFSKKSLHARHNRHIILGMRIQFKGRLNGRARGRKQMIEFGRLPLNSLKVPIQLGKAHALTKSGVCGIKVWVAFKPRYTYKVFKEQRKLKKKYASKKR